MASTYLAPMVPETGNLAGWIAVGLIASILILLQRLKAGPQLSQFPLLGKEIGSRRRRVEAFLYHPVELYQDGYRRFKDQIYRLTMPDGLYLPFHGRAQLAVFPLNPGLSHCTACLFDILLTHMRNTPGDHLIVPAKYLDELRNRSDDEIDVLKSFQDVRSPPAGPP